MSDIEMPHPTTGGKSLEAVMGTRAPYKSWRKKFRKMRAKFDAVLEDNKKLFKEEQKLEGLAKRLTEELDGLMEILLDLNQSSALPSSMRYDVTLPPAQRPHTDMEHLAQLAPEDIEPERANEIVREYHGAVQAGRLPPLDLHVTRLYVQNALGQQDLKPLPMSEVDHANFTQDHDPEGNPSFLTGEQEDAYLIRVDANPEDLRRSVEVPQASHQAELTPREVERQMELLNPQSQHNWLKMHSKAHPMVDDDESMLNDQAVKSAKKRQSGKGLARNLMDRMVREGFSPSEMSGMGDDEQDDASARRRGVDKDSTYRAKAGKNGGSTKSKRKRTTDDGAGGGKRIRASEIFD